VSRHHHPYDHDDCGPADANCPFCGEPAETFSSTLLAEVCYKCFNMFVLSVADRRNYLKRFPHVERRLAWRPGAA
jgi:hypothetical protein